MLIFRIFTKKKFTMHLKVENKTCDKVSSRLRIMSAEIIELHLIELQHFPLIGRVNCCSSLYSPGSKMLQFYLSPWTSSIALRFFWCSLGAAVLFVPQVYLKTALSVSPENFWKFKNFAVLRKKFKINQWALNFF